MMAGLWNRGCGGNSPVKMFRDATVHKERTLDEQRGAIGNRLR